MADCHVYYDELRFNVREEGLTNVYIFIRPVGDCPHTVGGWHFKAYPSSISTQDLINHTLWNGDKENDPLLWPKKAPPEPTLY